MERSIRIHRSFAEADRADRIAWRAMTPKERLDIQLDLINQHRKSLGEIAERFERVYRLVKLSES